MNTSMRQQLIESSKYLMENDKKVVCLLNDIGVWGFRHVKEQFPDRIYNLGILEQCTTSMAAGLSLVGLNPIFYTIAPFIVERAYEQLKDDFGYQCINGNFVSVGASFDYSKLGTTHYCPGDIGALLQIPNFEIIIPGTAYEFDCLFKERYNDGLPTYYRLSEHQNEHSNEVKFGKVNVLKKGSKATVIAVGNMLDKVLEATDGYDVNVVYCTTLLPFDIDTIKTLNGNNKILICEPYYSGALDYTLLSAFEDEYVKISHVGIEHCAMTTYGEYKEIENECGINVENIVKKVANIIK